MSQDPTSAVAAAATTASLALAHPLRPELILALVALIGPLVWWIYRRTPVVRRGVRPVLTILRVTVLLLVGVAILQPILRQPMPSAAAGTVLVGVDVSASMALADGAQSRLARAQAQLGGSTGLLARLHAAGSQVRLFSFGAQCREVPESALATLHAADQATDLAQAIRTMGDGVRGSSGNAMILFSDCADTTAASPPAAARRAESLGVAVHVVALGGLDLAPDVAISRFEAPPTVEVGASTPLSVTISRSHYAGPVVVRLYQGDTFLTQGTVPAGPGSVGSCVLPLVAARAGPLDVRVEAEPVAGETDLANNSRVLRIDAEERRLDVLMVEGSPRHEFAFIRRTMADDPHFRLVTLLRLGHQRYADSGAQGAGQEYDGSVLSSGFPTTAPELGRFSAIILSDIEAGEFSAAQLQLIHDFVTVRGGGLLMLGGTNAFNLGGYAQTPIAALLPVELDADAVSPTFDDRPFMLMLTPAGLSHEILRQGRSQQATEAQWRLMPPLKGLNVLLKAKPGAIVLALRTSPAPQSVVLAVQDVGAGRVAAFASANSWRWKMLRSDDDDSFRRFWSQMVRWLAVGNRQLLSVEVPSRIVPLGQPCSITARVLDARHLPANQATVTATITDPGGQARMLTLPWILSEDGAYEAQWVPQLPGSYQIAIQAVLRAGGTQGPPLSSTLSVLADASSPEQAHGDLDLAMARAIAAAGGGMVAQDGDGAAVVDAVLRQRRAQTPAVSVVSERDLADAPTLLLLICALLLGEWILRRTNGLS